MPWGQGSRLYGREWGSRTGQCRGESDGREYRYKHPTDEWWVQAELSRSVNDTGTSTVSRHWYKGTFAVTKCAARAATWATHHV